MCIHPVDKQEEGHKAEQQQAKAKSKGRLCACPVESAQCIVPVLSLNSPTFTAACLLAILLLYRFP